MAALSSIPATLLLGLPRSNPRPRLPAISALQPRIKVPVIRHASRLGESIALHIKHEISTVSASGVNPSEPETGREKAENSSSNVADGPPLPTILAGLVVFLLVCWFVGSILMWLIGLIVNAPSS